MKIHHVTKDLINCLRVLQILGGVLQNVYIMIIILLCWQHCTSQNLREGFVTDNRQAATDGYPISVKMNFF